MADRVTKVTLLASVGSYISDMNKAAKATQGTADEAEKAAKRIEEQNQAMRDIGGGVAAVGAIAAVAFGLAVAKFAEFDQAMSQVKAATQATTEDMGLLREAALEAGASTVFSATEAANAIEALGKANIKTADITGGALTGALDLAAAAGIGVAEAADIAAIAMKQFNLEGADVPHIADLLAAGAGKAVGDVDELAQALNQAGLVANGAGQSIEDTTGVLAAFADAGLKGSDAGTSLKAALIALQAPTDKARAVMEKYQLSFYDTNGQMLSFDKIAGQLKGNLSALTDEQRNAALAQIFGNDALRVANVLYDEGAQGIKRYIDQTNDSGYAAKVAADRLDNLTGDVEKLGGAIDTALIKSGSSVNDLLRTITQGATGIVDAVGDLPEPVIGLGTQLAGVVAAVGLVGGAALLAIPKIAQFKVALSTLNVSGASAAKGIGLASGALAVAGVAFSLWASRQAEATATAAEFQESLDETTGAVTNYTRELVAKKLAEAGAFEAAKEAGLSQKELTDAVIEGGEALDEVKAKFSENNTIFTFLSGVGIRAGNASTTIRDLSDGLDTARQNLDDQAAAAEGSAESTETAATAYQSAADNAAELQSNLRELIDTINEANGTGQDAVSANAAYQSALSGIAEEVQRQKDAYKELNGTLDGFAPSLNQATEEGSANAAMLAELAGKAQAAAEAQLEVDSATMTTEEATDKYLDTLEAQRQAFIDSATEAGFNADEVQALADQVFALPDEKEMAILMDTARAQYEIESFINRNNGRRVNIFADTQAGTVYRTQGSTIGYYADGGLLPGAPSRKDNMLIHAASGEFVVNSESTSRNRAVLDYINRGGVIRGYAKGGEVQPQYASGRGWMPSGFGSSRSVNVTTNIAPAQGMSEQEIGRISAERTVFALREDG